MDTPESQLRKFVRANLQGGCKIMSEGAECQCALCNLDRLVAPLAWYRDEARAIAANLAINSTTAVLASVTVLSLDNGSRALRAIGPDAYPRGVSDVQM